MLYVCSPSLPNKIARFLDIFLQFLAPQRSLKFFALRFGARVWLASHRKVVPRIKTRVTPSHTEAHQTKLRFWPFFLISQSQISRAILSNACGFNQVLMLLLLILIIKLFRYLINRTLGVHAKQSIVNRKIKALGKHSRTIFSQWQGKYFITRSVLMHLLRHAAIQLNRRQDQYLIA